MDPAIGTPMMVWPTLLRSSSAKTTGAYWNELVLKAWEQSEAPMSLAPIMSSLPPESPVGEPFIDRSRRIRTSNLTPERRKMFPAKSIKKTLRGNPSRPNSQVCRMTKAIELIAVAWKMRIMSGIAT